MYRQNCTDVGTDFKDGTVDINCWVGYGQSGSPGKHPSEMPIKHTQYLVYHCSWKPVFCRYRDHNSPALLATSLVRSSAPACYVASLSRLVYPVSACVDVGEMIGPYVGAVWRAPVVTGVGANRTEVASVFAVLSNGDYNSTSLILIEEPVSSQILTWRAEDALSRL